MSRLFGRAAVFVGMIEDFPYPENRVLLNPQDPEILTFEYTYRKELLARRKRFRKALLRAFRGHRRFMVSLQPMLNFGHPTGTLRFGTDPTRSVLRPDCRTHDLDNLYVADAAFMPSALGVNPSLTIAANALRVADIIAGRVQGRASP
ncbi:GMC family oxidoreductase [Rhodovulum sp.]|mgnify:CR=1 FL=1|uniref:GMC family oxidoreductase n=1 Tax=Rhodovulum sp. TaxID=34009 RepID=UPI0032E51168